MDIAKVRELVELVENSKIDELEITSKDDTIRIQKSASRPVDSVISLPAAKVESAPVPVSTTVPSDAPAPPSPERAKWKELRSPIVGTFYRAPSPESPTFASIGDKVSTGQTLCIIEAMKVMNEIKADVKGKILEILAEEGEPVEFGQPLFLIEPVE